MAPVDTPESVSALVDTLLSWERDPNGYKIKLGEINHHVSAAADMLARYAAMLASPASAPPSLDLTQMLRARCGACDHRWIVAHLPLDGSKVGRFAKVTCPACAERKAYVDTSDAVPTVLRPYVAALARLPAEEGRS